ARCASGCWASARRSRSGGKATDMGPTPSASGRFSRCVRVLLGLFILWQLFFLVAFNMLQLAQDVRPHLPPEVGAVVERVAPGWTREEGTAHGVTQAVTDVTGGWAWLTGQTQNWNLFAPGVYWEFAFTAVQLCWDDDPVPSLSPERVLLLSANEPSSLTWFVRIGNARLRRYEGNLTLALKERTGETTQQTTGGWRKLVEEHVAYSRGPIEAYLRWRWQAYRDAHPGTALPSQVILYARRYDIAAPEEAPPLWHGPVTTPLARWRP